MKNGAELIRLGERIRKLREAKGVSQQELADISELGKRTIQRIEGGYTNPTFDILVSLSKGLGVKLKELCDL